MKNQNVLCIMEKRMSRGGTAVQFTAKTVGQMSTIKDTHTHTFTAWKEGQIEQQ